VAYDGPSPKKFDAWKSVSQTAGPNADSYGEIIANSPGSAQDFVDQAQRAQGIADGSINSFSQYYNAPDGVMIDGGVGAPRSYSQYYNAPDGIMDDFQEGQRYWRAKAIASGRMDEDGNIIGDALDEETRAWLESGGSFDTHDSDLDKALANNIKELEAADDDYWNPFTGGGLFSREAQAPPSKDEQFSLLAMTTPGVAQAIAESGMKPADVATGYNLAVAMTVADLVETHANNGDIIGGRQMLNALPLEQRIIATAIADERAKVLQVETNKSAYERRQAEIQGYHDWREERKIEGIVGVDPVVDPNKPVPAKNGGVYKYEEAYTVGDALNMIVEGSLWGMEQVTHAARMGALMTGNTVDRLRGQDVDLGEFLNNPDGTPANSNRWLAIWDATSEGFISQGGYNELVDKYGKRDTDIMVGYYKATLEDDPEAMTQFFASINDDEYAMSLVNGAMHNSAESGSNAAELFVDIAARDQGNYGSLVAGGVGLDPQTMAFTALRDSVNVASTFAFDPLTYAFGVGTAVKASKYSLATVQAMGKGNINRGMAALLRAEKVDHGVVGLRWTGKANEARPMYDAFGKDVADLKRLRALETEQGRAQALMKEKEIRRKYLRGNNAPFTEEDLKFAIKNDLDSASKWATYYDEVADAQDLLMARPVPVPEAAPGPGFGGNLGKYSPRGKAEQAAKEAAAKAEQTAYNAAEAKFGEGMDLMTARLARGSNARRGLYVPHSYSSRASLVYGFQRINDARAANAQKELAKIMEIVGPETRGKSLAEIEEMLTIKLSTDDAFAKAFGEVMSNWKYGRAAGEDTETMVRTAMGKFADNHPRIAKAMGMTADKVVNGETVVARKRGWKREGNIFKRSKEAAGRMLQRIPSTPDGLITATGEHADEIYLYARAANLSDTTASLLRHAWAHGDEASRQNMAIGLVQSFTRALGIHAVSPELEAKVLHEVTGLSWKELYTTTQVVGKGRITAELREQARLQVVTKADEYRNLSQAKLDKELKPLREQLEAAKRSRKKRSHIIEQIEQITAKHKADLDLKLKEAANQEERIFKHLRKQEQKKGGRLHPSYNPSKSGVTGRSSALYMGQTTDRISFPSFKAMDEYAARTSFLNALLFQNTAGGMVTDAWVLGTLAGPRFQLRNGLEDAGMYALTGGKISSAWRGRRLGQIIDANIARVNQDYVVAKDVHSKMAKELEQAKRAHAAKDTETTADALQRAQDKFDSASRELTKAESAKTLFSRTTKVGRHAKLGFVRTQVVDLSERATYRVDKNGVARERDGLVSKIAQFLVPTTSGWERQLAANGGREAAAALAAKAVLRHKFVFTNKGWKSWVPTRAKSFDDLTPKQQQYYRYEEELINSSYGMQLKDQAAETAQHYADGAIPLNQSAGQYMKAPDGTIMQKVHLSKGYEQRGLRVKRVKTADGEVTVSGLSVEAATAFAAKLRFVADRYTVNQAALHQVPQYHRAINGTARHSQWEAEKIIDRVFETVRNARDYPLMVSRFRLVDEQGVREHIRRTLDDMADTFSSKDGEWNQNLWRALRHEDEKGKPFFDASEITEERLIAGGIDDAFDASKFPDAYVAHVSDNADMFVPVGTNWFDKMSVGAWGMMGRSLARMTRNPIWYGNYIDSRMALAPMEKEYARVFGQKAASRKFTEAAADRAYTLTMAYVDNPNVRTNLAWQVRNIARYYRAQEDFARRVIRMGKFNPVSIQKANLAWAAQEDFGFTYKDQYGEEYFIYPGSAAVMGVLQNLTGLTGSSMFKYTGSPVGFSGKVQWLSPSLDPASWLPTVSSPWMSITLQPLLRSMPQSREFMKMLETAAFGQVGANMDYADLEMEGGIVANFFGGVYQTLPPTFKKALGLAKFVDLKGGYRHKASMRIAQAMAATGQLGDTEDWADEDHRNEMFAKLDTYVTWDMALGLIFGLVAPASPQLAGDNLSIAAREAGYESLNPAFRAMIESSTQEGVGYMDALMQWMKERPQDSIWIEPTREFKRGTTIAATDPNYAFLRENEEAYFENPVGLSFLTPDPVGTSTSDKALAAMKFYNMYEYRDYEKFVEGAVNAQADLDRYSLEQAEAADRAGVEKYDEDGNITEEWKFLDEVSSAAKKELNNKYPRADEGLIAWMDKSEQEFAVEANDLLEAVRAFEGKNEQADTLMPLLEGWLGWKADLNTLNSFSDTYDEDKKMLNDSWRAFTQEWWRGAQGSYDESRGLKVVKLLTWSVNKGLKDITLEGGE
jgi:hypothetical protein